MDRHSRDSVVEAFEQAGLDMNLIEVMPSSDDIPKEGIRFLTVVLLDQTLKYDLMRSLKNNNLLDGLGADPDSDQAPSLRALKAGPSNHLDLLFEDTKMRGSGVEEQKAQSIYRFQHIGVLNLERRQYDVLTKIGITSLGLLSRADPSQLSELYSEFNTDDIELINGALADFDLSMGCNINDV